MKTTSSFIISTSSILTVNLFFNSFIKLSTKISGADAPEEIPMVFEFWIKSNGISLCEWINCEFKQPDFFATSTNLTELEEFLLPITKNRFTVKIDEVEIIKENVVFKAPKKLN